MVDAVKILDHAGPLNVYKQRLPDSVDLVHGWGIAIGAGETRELGYTSSMFRTL